MSQFPGSPNGAGWGDDPNVARFFGGPRDGDVEYIGTTDVIAVPIIQDTIHSWGSVVPQYVNVGRCVYVREEIATPTGPVTVMAEQGMNRTRLSQEVADAWEWNRLWQNPVQIIVSQTGNWFFAPIPAIPRPTPEEAVAWVFDGKGKDFL